ncbi:hypothetical protein [Maricaulis sp.]|uniref:hypothetical protein n=1 Tax=Maricaulis sp. TaxID=1486257 RepID=UPI0026250CBD|nr:hypothetical protein [Maricaulis sp.]
MTSTKPSPTQQSSRSPLLARAQLMQILRACEDAGLYPTPVETIHAVAFLASFLSPLWGVTPLASHVLKSDDGPYYPSLQRQLDHLVGQRLVDVDEIRYRELELGGARIAAEFSLNSKNAPAVLKLIDRIPGELEVARLFFEIAVNLQDVEAQQSDDVARMDASYSDPEIARNRIVAFNRAAIKSNKTVESARKFEWWDESYRLDPPAQLEMYMQLLKARAHG